MQLTWLDSNSWLIEIAQLRILLDPWLVDSLVFANSPWFYEGKKRTQRPIPDNIDFILLSQGLEDHAHTPTLKQLNHSLPVVASENATKVCQELGYQEIHTLKHGESYIFADKVEIKAVPGSLVGFNLIENGYIIRHLTTGESIYYEPHGTHSTNLQQEDAIKVIITPLNTLRIPFVGPVIKGQETAIEVCRWLKPEYILPTAAGGDVEFEGLLAKVLKEEGTLDNFRSLLRENNLSTQVVESIPGKPISL